jgi:hypothetical protein
MSGIPEAVGVASTPPEVVGVASALPKEVSVTSAPSEVVGEMVGVASISAGECKRILLNEE